LTLIEEAPSAERILRTEPPAPPVRRQVRPNWWPGFSHRAPGIALVLFGLAIIARALAVSSARFPALADDEGTYVAQAWALRTRGSLSHYTYWYDHPPLGWVQLAFLTVVGRPLTWLAGSTGSAVLDARRMMMIPALTSVVLVYVLARRCGIGRAYALLAMFAFGLSPLSVSMLRQVYLDGLALPWVLAAFVLVLSPRCRLWAFAASGTCFAIGVLSKETMLVLLPALVVALWYRCDRRTRAFCVTAFAVPCALLVLGYPLFAFLKGELMPGAHHVSLSQALWFQLAGRASTGSALIAGTGSRGILATWVTQDAWLLAAGLVALPGALALRRLRPVALAVLVLTLVGLRPGYLPAPYVLALLPFCAICAAGLIEIVIRHAWATARSPHVAGTRLRATPVVRLGAAIIGISVISGCVFVADHWAAQRRANDAWNSVSATMAAEAWVETHIDHRARVLVDDTYFVDLVNDGFDPNLGVVWFYKLDFSTNLDPSVVRALPGGYRDFDYVVSSPIIRAALSANPGRLSEVRLALRAGRPVASFGSGASRVVISRIVGPHTGSGRMVQHVP
jgi:hypothetical protein